VPALSSFLVPPLLPVQVSSRRRPNESDADWAKRQEAARQEVNSHLLVFIHGALQALTAIGLLQVRMGAWGHCSLYELVAPSSRLWRSVVVSALLCWLHLLCLLGTPAAVAVLLMVTQALLGEGIVAQRHSRTLTGRVHCQPEQKLMAGDHVNLRGPTGSRGCP
jgi:hypothetical protein